MFENKKNQNNKSYPLSPNPDHSTYFEILEHKADLKIKVFGKEKKELFKNAMVGMFESAKYEPVFSKKMPANRIKRKIKISSLDLTSLLVDFLSEILYLSEINREVYWDVHFKKFTQKTIEGTLFGEKLKKIGINIKGVTYHDLTIRKNKEGLLEATILFDI